MRVPFPFYLSFASSPLHLYFAIVRYCIIFALSPRPPRSPIPIWRITTIFHIRHGCGSALHFNVHWNPARVLSSIIITNHHIPIMFSNSIFSPQIIIVGNDHSLSLLDILFCTILLLMLLLHIQSLLTCLFGGNLAQRTPRFHLPDKKNSATY